MKKRNIFAVIILTLMIMLVCSGCAAKAFVPNVKEAFFDFSITYEVYGEEHTYNGVYVCEYDGIYITVYGSTSLWKDYVEDNEEMTILIEENDEFSVYIILALNPEYFMNDPGFYGEIPKPMIYAEFSDQETGEVSLIWDEEVIYENFGSRIISYNYPEPIENDYQEKWSFGKFEPGIN